MSGVLARFKQRKLVQWAIAYVAFAFALIQVLDVVTQQFGWPESVRRGITLVLAVGFIVTLVIAWYHGEKGRQRVSGPELLLIALVLAIGGGLVWRFARVSGMSGNASVASSPDAAKRNPGTTIPDSTAAAAAPGLRVASTQAVPIPAKSIAVLPFENLSGDASEKYFSDGITEEILNALAQIPNLKVAGRTSAFQFSSKDEDLRKVGATLGVANVLEGSVQKAGDEVRINVQLIDTRTGYQRWSEKYDRKLSNIFAIEDDISSAIAGKLRVQLTGGGQPTVLSETTDLQAHALYLQGIAKIAQRGPALKAAVALLEQATARDPDYAAAWAELSQAYELLPWYNLGDWQRSLDKAESAAQRALALNPRLGEGHAALANVQRDRLDFADADKEYRQALALNPGSSEIHNQYAQLLGAIGQFDAAIKHEQIAVSLDPLAPNPRYMLGVSLVSVHRYDDAIAAFRKVIAQTPSYPFAHYELAFCYLYVADYAEAEKVVRAAASKGGGETPAINLALIRAVADPSLKPDALKRIESAHQIGEVELGDLAQAFWYSLLGAHDKAIESLQYWAATPKPGEQFNGIRYLWMPAFDPIRDDPRFKAVLKKMGLPYTQPK